MLSLFLNQKNLSYFYLEKNTRLFSQRQVTCHSQPQAYNVLHLGHPPLPPLPPLPPSHLPLLPHHTAKRVPQNVNFCCCLDNLEARRGMRLIAKSGYVKPFHFKQFRDMDEIVLWKLFAKRGKAFIEILREKKPDIALTVTNIYINT